MLLSISGGSDLGLFEINEAARLVQEAAHPEANIIFGAVIDDALGDEVRVTVIAAGFDGGQPKRRDEGATLRKDPRPETKPAARSDAERATVAASAPASASSSDRPAQPTAPRPAPTQVQFDDDDLDVPDFLK